MGVVTVAHWYSACVVRYKVLGGPWWHRPAEEEQAGGWEAKVILSQYNKLVTNLSYVKLSKKKKVFSAYLLGSAE